MQNNQPTTSPLLISIEQEDIKNIMKWQEWTIKRGATS